MNNFSPLALRYVQDTLQMENMTSLLMQMEGRWKDIDIQLERGMITCHHLSSIITFLNNVVGTVLEVFSLDHINK